MYSVPLTIALCPLQRLHTSVSESARSTSVDRSATEVMLARGMELPYTLSGAIEIIWRSGSIRARTMVKRPAR